MGVLWAILGVLGALVVLVFSSVKLGSDADDLIEELYERP